MADLDQIFAKLETVDGKVDELLIWRAVHGKEHEVIKRDLIDVRKTLYDDNPGLKFKVERLWNGTTITQGWKEFWLYVVKIIIATGAIVVIGRLLMLFVD